jgi:hypothetical protein
MTSASGNIDRTRFGDLPGIAQARNRIYGVEQRYLQVVFNEYYMLVDFDHTLPRSQLPMVQGNPDVIALMYTGTVHFGTRSGISWPNW